MTKARVVLGALLKVPREIWDCIHSFAPCLGMDCLKSDRSIFRAATTPQFLAYDEAIIVLY